MEQKRKENINANVKLMLKNCSTEEIGFLGILLTDVIQKREKKLELERETLTSMLCDPKEEYFKGEENQFLLQIINDEEELQYFVAEMQKNIVKELENEKNTFSDKDIERLRDFFTLEALEGCNADKKNSCIRKLIIALWCDETIIIEECYGISKEINEFLEKMNELEEKMVLRRDLQKAIEAIKDLQKYLDS